MQRMILAILFLFSLAVAGGETLPELDIVVTTKLTPNTLPTEHSQAVVRALQKDAREVFFKLAPRGGLPNAQPADGAAKFRLFLDHMATITIGTQVASKSERQDNVGGGSSHRRWFLPFDQKASISVRLAEWKDGKYVDLLKFSAPVPRNENEIKEGNQLMVQQRTFGDASGEKDDATFKMPMEEARGTVLRRSLPPTLRTVYFSKLVPITLVKASPIGPTEAQVELKVENKTPWPLKKAEFAFAQGGKNYICGEERGTPGNQSFSLPEPLAPGQTTTIKTKATKHDGNLSPGTYHAEFVVPE